MVYAACVEAIYLLLDKSLSIGQPRNVILLLFVLCERDDEVG